MNDHSASIALSGAESVLEKKLGVSALRPGDIAAVSELTFPSFRANLARCLSGEAHDGFESVALVIRDDEIPVGLALAQLPAIAAAREGAAVPPRMARLLSVFILPAWRKRGAASLLMLVLEDELRRRGCVGLVASYTTQMPAWQPFERLLAACRWSPPAGQLLMSMGYCREVIKAPWMKTLGEMPPGFELFEWTGLRADERAQLQHDEACGMIPQELSPFSDEQDIEPSISVGVRHQGEVVAWMTVTRSPLVSSALCYRSKFVRPHLRASLALGPLILAAALRLHAASPIGVERPVGVFGMSFKASTKMINFFRKRLAPFCFRTYESRMALKMLE